MAHVVLPPGEGPETFRSVIKTEQGLQDHDIAATSNVRSIRYLSCQGGGMKGGAFAGVARGLEDAGVLSQLEAVAGSSAGAIFATLLAVGFTASEIEEEMGQLDFRRLQDKDAPGWIEATGIKELAKGFTPDKQGKLGLLRKLPIVKQLIELPEKAFSGLEKVEDVAGLVFSKKLGIWKGDALLTLVQRLIARKTGKPDLTFKELAELSGTNPRIFHKLILTGSNLTTGRLEYYNAKDWPDLPIIHAVRISASFPGAFMPFTQPLLQRKVGPDGKPVVSKGVRVDGGLLANLPLPDDFDLSETLALSFKDSQAPKKTEIDSGMALLKALYSTVMSEQAIREKFGDNLVEIDTVGMKTLEFTASKSKRDKLVQSGYDCLAKTLKKLNGRKIKIEDMTAEQLVRYENDILERKKTAESQKEFERVHALLRQKVRQMVIEKSKESGEELNPEANVDQIIEQMEALEDERRLSLKKNAVRRKELKRKLETVGSSLAHASVNAAIRNDVIQQMKLKIEELRNIKAEQQMQIQELTLLRAAFELEKVGLQQQSHARPDVQQFESRLLSIRALKTNIIAKKKEYSDIMHQLATVKRKLKELKTSKKLQQVNDLKKEKRRLEERLNGHEKSLSAIEHEKDQLINGIIKEYEHRKDYFMSNYFDSIRDLFEDPTKNEQFPTSMESLTSFIEGEERVADEYLKGARKNLRGIDKDIKVYQDHLSNFEKAKDTEITSLYDNFKTLKTELERSIFEKTSFLGKVNNYFTSDKPSWKNTLITSALQFVAFTAFLARVGLAIAAVGVFPPAIPYVIYKLVKLVKNSNSEGPAKYCADLFIRVFSMPNLFKLNKLRYLSRVTADTAVVLDKNYSQADSTERSHIFRLFQVYLKNSGLKFHDLLPYKESDTQASYKATIDKFIKEFQLEERGLSQEEKSRMMRYLRGEKAREAPDQMSMQVGERRVVAPIYKNQETFYKRVKGNLMEPVAELQLAEKPPIPGIKRGREAATQYEFYQRRVKERAKSNHKPGKKDKKGGVLRFQEPEKPVKRPEAEIKERHDPDSPGYDYD